MASDDEMEVGCPVCQEEYETGTRNPMSQACGHTVCEQCAVELGKKGNPGYLVCPTCRANNPANSLMKNYCLGDAITVIKKLREKPVPKNSVQCTTCEKIDSEADMFVCRKCIADVFKFDVLGAMNRDIELDVKTTALCGSCAIRKHVQLGHETVAYFPVSSAIQFENHLSSIGLLRKDLDEQVERTGQWYMAFEATALRFNQELDRMTEMMRKSTSSKIQRTFMARIDEETKKFSRHVLTIANSISDNENQFQNGFDELCKKNDVDEMQKCEEIVRTTLDGPCNDCKSKKPYKEMFCCRDCSEIVKELMNDTMETVKVGDFEIESLPICTNCVIVGHHGQNHQVVKYEDVRKKFYSVVRLATVQTKETILNQRFSQLLRTFEVYVSNITNYDNQVSKMSEIVSKTRGHPDHEIVVEEFQKVINEAESIISALLVNAEDGKRQIEGRLEPSSSSA